MYQKIVNQLNELSEPEFAEWLKPFLNIKSDSEEVLLGIRVPKLRKLASKYKNIDTKIVERLLTSNIHECRELALFIMLHQVKNFPDKICGMYLRNLKYINNWDLIDYTAPHIVAPNVSETKLRELSDSDYMWANRVAIVSTIYFIKQGKYDLTLEFAEKFITHEHHLIHKACGWMLREVGKKDVKTLEKFLDKNEKKMPSIMRNYAKEKLKKY